MVYRKPPCINIKLNMRQFPKKGQQMPKKKKYYNSGGGPLPKGTMTKVYPNIDLMTESVGYGQEVIDKQVKADINKLKSQKYRGS